MVVRAAVLARIRSSRGGFQHRGAAPLRRSWLFLADSRQRAEHGPAGSLALLFVLPSFAFGVVAGGVSRVISGRCARCRPVVRFLQRAVLCEVGEDGFGAAGQQEARGIRKAQQRFHMALLAQHAQFGERMRDDALGHQHRKRPDERHSNAFGRAGSRSQPVRGAWHEFGGVRRARIASRWLRLHGNSLPSRRWMRASPVSSGSIEAMQRRLTR